MRHLPSCLVGQGRYRGPCACGWAGMVPARRWPRWVDTILVATVAAMVTGIVSFERGAAQGRREGAADRDALTWSRNACDAVLEDCLASLEGLGPSTWRPASAVRLTPHEPWEMQP